MCNGTRWREGHLGAPGREVEEDTNSTQGLGTWEQVPQEMVRTQEGREAGKVRGREDEDSAAGAGVGHAEV